MQTYKETDLKLNRKLVKSSVLDKFMPKEYTEKDAEVFSIYAGYFPFCYFHL